MKTRAAAVAFQLSAASAAASFGPRSYIGTAISPHGNAYPLNHPFGIVLWVLGVHVLWRQLNKIRCAARGPGGVRPGHGTCHRLDEVRSCLISAISGSIVSVSVSRDVARGRSAQILPLRVMSCALLLRP